LLTCANEIVELNDATASIKERIFIGLNRV
jgi:hypothetical protein